MPVRSESTEYEKGKRELSRTPPVTVLEDAIGRVHEPTGRNNAFRDAIREGAASKMRAAGDYSERGAGTDNYVGEAPDTSAMSEAKEHLK